MATRDDYAAFLESGSWTHWGTLTTVESYSTNAMRRAVERHLQRLKPSYAVWVTDRGFIGGRSHLHVLYNFGRSSLSPESLARQIEKIWGHGRADVAPFVPLGGAASYVSKALDHHDAEYDFWIRRN